MRRRFDRAWRVGGLLLLGLALTSPQAIAQSCAIGETPAVFGFTGGEQTVVVPAGVVSATVYLSGAQGGAGRSGAGTIGGSPNSPGGTGGLGGRVRGTLAVTPGATLSVWVGGQASQAVNPGGIGQGVDGIGGGATDLRVGGNAIGNRVGIAGGGGGGGNAGWSTTSVIAGGNGGVGGGGTGGSGADVPGGPGPYGGGGGAVGVGGAGGGGCGGFPATAGNAANGDGGDSFNFSGSFSGAGYGGGGGGGATVGAGGGGAGVGTTACQQNWNGGGGGGAGGSSAATGLSGVVINNGVQTGNGAALVCFAPPPAPIANAVSATVAYGSSNNPITLNITGGTPTSVAVATQAGQGTATASGTSISYTPTAGYAGPDSFTYTATNAAGTSAPATVTITVSAPTINLSPATLPAGSVGAAYSQTITASGGAAPYSYAVTAGALPAGMTLATSTGALSGTPTAGGTFNFTVTATDSSTGTGPFTGSRAYTLTVNAPTIALSPSSLPGATGGTPYSQTITAAGGTAPYTYSLTSGSLPVGMSFSSAGILSGTPVAAGTFNFTVTATDSSTGTGPFTGSRAYTLVVAAPTITLSPTTFPAGVVGTAYTQTITASGGTAPYTYSLTAGALPVGMSFSSGGVFSGTPVAAGTYNFTVMATDAFGFNGSQAYSVVVGQAAQVITNFVANPASPTYSPGGTFALSATAGASTSPVVFASTTTAICTVSGSTVTMLGAGTCSLTANQAGDANYTAAPQLALDVTITAAAQAITNFIATPSNPTYAPNGTFALSATAGASTSPVVFASTTTAICTVSGSTVTMLGAGTCSLTANQAGDANYTAAPQVSLNVTIAAATQAITSFAANPSAPTYAPNGTFALSATAGASTSPVVFASTTTTVCTVSGSTVTMLGAGACSLTANQAGDANYTAAPQVGLNVTIGAATPVLGWTGPLHKIVGEAAFDLPTPTSTSPGTFTYSSSNASVATISGRTVTIVGPGTATLTANQAATANYTAASISILLTVDARPDPTQDASVVDGLQAQVDASVRFADAQQDNVLGRLRQLRTSQGTPSQYALSMSYQGRYGNGMSMPLAANGAGQQASQRDYGVWTAGSILLGERGARNGGDGFDMRSDGITLGMDRAFGDFVFGAAAGAGWGDADFADDRSRQDASQRSLMLYGLWRGSEHWYVDGVLGWGRLDFDLARWSDTANALATARREGDQQFGSLSVGYIQRGTRTDITGYGRLEASRTDLDAYRESGLGIYDLAYRNQRIENSTITAGVEGSHRMQLGEHAVRPFWSLEYRSALRNNGDAAMNYVVMPVASDYVLRLRSYADNLWAFGAGVDFELARGWQMSFSYRREQGNGVSGDGFGLRLSFGGLAPVAPLAPLAPLAPMLSDAAATGN